jgi:hypothetical protein
MDARTEIPSLAQHAVLAGLCPLIPSPVVDDAIENVFRRRMVREILQERGFEASDTQVRTLTEAPRRFFLGCLLAMLVYPIKKLFRKFFFVLALKDCVDEASRVLHEGLLLRHALSTGRLDAALLSDPKALGRFRDTMLRTLATTDTRPLNQILRKAFGTGGTALRKAASALQDQLTGQGRRPLREAQAYAALDADPNGPPEVERLVRQVEVGLFTEEGYLDRLLLGFERALDVAVEPPDPSPGDPC